MKSMIFVAFIMKVRKKIANVVVYAVFFRNINKFPRFI